MKKLTPNMEDYMKAIYKLHRASGDGTVHISNIAADMGVRKASVCNATGVLEEKGFVRKDKYVCLYLTEAGLQYAVFIEQRHSVLTRFLNEILGVTLDTAEQDACGMEHVISGESYRSIRSYLGKTVNDGI
jgi:Mn-dependent DtxR family transcriptional regulator